MAVSDLLSKVLLNLKAISKNDVIDELAIALHQAGKISDLNVFKEAILKREMESTTGIGEGIAIPHAKSRAVNEPSIVFGRSAEGLDYEALDGQPSHLFFMIAVPEGANNEHLEALSKLSTYLMDPGFKETLLKAETEEDVVSAFKVKEQEEGDVDTEDTDQAPVEETVSRKRIVAVTACPTGIAHTFMAADHLKAKAKELGYDIKVQTNGSSGVKNKLTKEDIEEADGVIVAASTKVDLEPFVGKPLVQAPVTDGIREPERLLKKAAEGEAAVYEGDSSSGRKGDDSEAANGRSGFYKHLMNGVSNMLPLVVGGGILIALSFLIDIDGNNPISQLFMTIGGDNAFFLLVPVLSGFIAMSIADRPGLAPGLVGGLMAANGGAGFLGGLISGFLAGYAVVLLKKAFRNLPQSLEGLKPVLLYPLFGILITGVVMSFIVGPLGGFNEWLKDALSSLGTGNAVLLGVIIGGMMAIDMGGPINKAAYTFGIALVEAGNYGPMAAIMAGGMVPPLGMAIATTIFKNRFNRQEREAGKTAYILGVSFITEAAIPFAAADPVRVISASIAGSALAGGLSMLFGNATPAPHGGLFVILTVNNAILYIVAILAGALLTAFLTGIMKKTKTIQ
ncbi:PTS fructose transporter subunit IIABC [Pseudalkalibacillus salsuginis]|uniref:PTS fructose transporter subunit IIABC n=1 Tax=Pseudalkalibacillus salsuginis TaxID=2910972 RepID=UPI001F3A88B5|nr:fructose-specific PTS transporter subunit EIIC [Pseudalkalibacillus salsuginis]MCF6409334.1 fructose-specific PTS transporter subunit EIIC [Pseudalkalibacillus salsuginis]